MNNPRIHHPDHGWGTISDVVVDKGAIPCLKRGSTADSLVLVTWDTSEPGKLQDVSWVDPGPTVTIEGMVYLAQMFREAAAKRQARIERIRRGLHWLTTSGRTP